jgi:DHA2 family multidrug resistance protein
MAAPSFTLEKPEPHVAHKWLITVAVVLGAAMEILDTSIVNVALPYMRGSFNASVDQITWVLTGYIVANGIMIPMTGWIATRVGRKRYFMTSVVIFMIASSLCGMATSLHEIVIFRLLQGAAGAAMVPLSQAILMETFPPSEQAMAMAMWGLGIIMAPILGPTLGGYITDTFNWRWNFYINVPVGIVCLMMVGVFVHDPSYLKRARRRYVDYWGIALLVLSIGLMQLVLNRGQRSDWFAAPWVRYCTFASILGFILMVWRELQFPEPILELRTLKTPAFTLSVFVMTFMVMTIYSINLLNPLFFEDLLGYTAWNAGLAVLPRGVGAGVAMLLVGQLSRYRIDSRPLMGIGFAVGAWASWQMAHWTLQISMASTLWPIMLFGLVSAGFPILSAAGLTDVPRERMGYAASLYNMMRSVGASVGIAMVSALLVQLKQVHQSHLVNDLSTFKMWQLSERGPRVPGVPYALKFNYSQELITGQKQGLAILYHTVQKQAALMSYNDLYRWICFLLIFLIPWFVFFKRTTGGSRMAE